MVICLELGADLHMVQLMPLPLTVSCFSKIQIGFTFLVPGSPGKRAAKQVCVCVCALCCRKRRKQQITTLAIRRGARKPWQPVVKTSNSVDGPVVLLD